MKLFNFFKKAMNKISYHTPEFYHCLQLFSKIGSARNNPDGIVELFNKAYKEDQALALKILVYARDIHNGLGQRDTFRVIFHDLCKNDPVVGMQLIPYICEFGRYDDLFAALDTELEDKIIYLIRETLKEDMENLSLGKPVSLLAKWMPSINASSKETIKLAKYLMVKLNMSAKEYRKTLSCLRKGNIIENYLREKDYTFDYQKVSIGALCKYHKAFLRNDKKRYRQYLNNVNNDINNKKVVLYPHDIVKEVCDCWGELKKLSKKDKEEIQSRWENLIRNHKIGNTIVMRDGSWSMQTDKGKPLLICNSLAIYFSELAKGDFKNKFITFSKNPKLVEIKAKDLYGKLQELSKYDDNSNGDISKVYELLLDIYKKENIKENFIERIIIISDMESCLCVDGLSSCEEFKKEFESLNIKMPEIIFWNVNSNYTCFNRDDKYDNIQYINGSSNKIIDNLINDKELDNFSFVMEMMEKYDFIDDFLLFEK